MRPLLLLLAATTTTAIIIAVAVLYSVINKSLGVTFNRMLDVGSLTIQIQLSLTKGYSPLLLLRLPLLLLLPMLFTTSMVLKLYARFYQVFILELFVIAALF